MSNIFSSNNTDFEIYRYRVLREIENVDMKYRSGVVYLSGPMTGIEDYRDRFKSMEELVIKAYELKNGLIINPVKYFDDIPENLKSELTYFDMMLFSFDLLRLCNIMVIDTRTDDWKNSKGVYSEIGFASGNRTKIVDMDSINELIRIRKGFMLS